MTPAFVHSLQDTLLLLRDAQNEAFPLVEKELRAAHFQKTQGSLSGNPGIAWEELYDSTGNEVYLALQEITNSRLRIGAIVSLFTRAEAQA